MLALEDDASPDAVHVPVRVENHLGETFEARTLCVSIDGRRISDAWAKHPGALLREHQPVELGARLRPGVVHRVRLIVLFFGAGRAEGYTFVITTEHEIPPDELRPEVLTAKIVEFGGADTPIQMRPQVKWHSSGSNAVRFTSPP